MFGKSYCEGVSRERARYHASNHGGQACGPFDENPKLDQVLNEPQTAPFDTDFSVYASRLFPCNLKSCSKLVCQRDHFFKNLRTP